MEDIVKEYIDTKCSIQFLAKKYKFEMSLAEKDKEHLEKFNNFINHSRNIKLKIVLYI